MTYCRLMIQEVAGAEVVISYNPVGSCGRQGNGKQILPHIQPAIQAHLAGGTSTVVRPGIDQRPGGQRDSVRLSATPLSEFVEPMKAQLVTSRRPVSGSKKSSLTVAAPSHSRRPRNDQMIFISLT
jgi:hypothetical protein